MGRNEKQQFRIFSPYDYSILSSSDDIFIIGIFGGSVARWFSLQGAATLIRELANLTELNARQLVLLNFGHAGYKQPQQLLALSYFMSIGQHFDLIINIDGFNEAVFGTENLERGKDPSLPVVERLNELLKSSIDNEYLFYAARSAKLRNKTERLRAQRADAVTAFTYMLANSRLNLVQSRLDQHLQAPPEDSSSKPDVILFPKVNSEERRLTQSIVDDWGRASEMMARLAESAEAHYMHILQANQYHSSRRLSDRERRIAIHKKGRPVIGTIYPLGASPPCV